MINNMKKRVIKKNGRDKAFIGAIIGNVAGIAGDFISAKKQKQAEELTFKQNQTEQNRIDGVNQAASMTSSYVNQDYVNQYLNKVTLKSGGKVKLKNNKDRLVVAKKYAIGGRKKNEMGSMNAISEVGKTAADNLSAIRQGLSNSRKVADSIDLSGKTINSPTNNLSVNSILDNRKIGKEADDKKLIIDDKVLMPDPLDIDPNSVMLNPNKVINNNRMTAQDGGSFGSLGNDFAEAAPGLGTLAGALLTKPKAARMIKKADAFTFEAPKVGLTANSYQVDANGVPITTPINNEVINPLFNPRLATAKMGKRISKRSMKSGL